jgi:hypothetical protein
MPKMGSGLAGKLLAMAEEHGGCYVTLDEAVGAIFNGGGGAAARRRVYGAVYVLASEGRLLRRRCSFAWPVVDDAVVTPRPVRVALAVTLNRFAALRNAYDAAFDDLLTEARHAIRVSEPGHGDVDAPAGFPMRCAEPGEREA